MVYISNMQDNRKPGDTGSTLEDELRKGLLFSRLSDKQLARIAQKTCQVELREGEALFEQGDEADRFYLVVNGHLKLFRLSPDGNEKVIEVVSPGQTFAEALMFLDASFYPVGAQALSRARVLSVDSKSFLQMLRESVELCFLMMGDMSFRLRGLIQEIDDLSLHSATCRVAGYLLTNAPEGESRFDLKIPKQVLASRLSVKPETFSRIIKRLNSSNILEFKGSHVEIKDFQRLREIANVCALPGSSI